MIGSRVSQNAPGGIMIPTPAQAYVQQRRHHHRCRAPGLGAPRPLRAHHRGRAPLPQRPAWRRRICQRVGWLRGPICNVPALSKQPTPPFFQLLVTKGYLPLLIMTSDLDVPPSWRIRRAIISYKTSNSPRRWLISSQPTPMRRITRSDTHGKSTFVTTIAIYAGSIPSRRHENRAIEKTGPHARPTPIKMHRVPSCSFEPSYASHVQGLRLREKPVLWKRGSIHKDEERHHKSALRESRLFPVMQSGQD